MVRMKPSKLKLIDGGAQKLLLSAEKSATARLWETVWTFGVSGIVWIVIGYWIWKFFYG